MLLPAGYLLGFDEGNWGTGTFTLPATNPTGGRGITVAETETALTLSGSSFTYVFDRFTGTFSSMVFGGLNLLKKPMDLQIWRAPTDNDMYIRAEWQRAHLDQAYTRTYSSSWQQVEEGGVLITAHLGLVACTVQRILTVTGERVGQSEGFSFNASPFSAEELTRAVRNVDLCPAGATVLSLDYQQNGIGSNSYGPELFPQYRFNATKFTLKLTLNPGLL